MSILLPAGALVLTVEDAQILYQRARIGELKSKHRDDDRAYRIFHAIAVAAFSASANESEQRKPAQTAKTEYTTVPQVARQTGLSEAAVRNHIRDGILPATKNGREWIILTADADVYIAARRKN